MIIRYFKGNISKEYLRVITNTTSKGTSAYDLIKGAKEVGLDGIGLTGNILSMDINNIPCITHINNNGYNHFAVITNIDYKKKIITLMDPDKGKRVLSLDEYNSISFNNYIVFKPYKELIYQDIGNSAINTLKETVIDNKNVIINAIALSIIYIIFNILISYRFKIIYDLSIIFGIKTNLLAISLVLLLIIIVKDLSLYFKNILIILFKRNIDLVLTFKTYNKIMSLPYLYYHNKTTGEVVSRLEETSMLSNSVLNVLLSILDILLIIITSISIYLINKSIFIVVLLFMILFIYVGIINSVINKKYINNIKVKKGISSSKLFEFINNIELINNNKISNYTNNIFYKKFTDLIMVNEKYNLNQNMYNFITNLLIDLVFIIVSIYGGILVIDNKLVLSNYIIIESLLSYLFNPISTVLSNILELSNIKVIINRLNDFYNIKDREDYKDDVDINKLELKNINYEISNKVLLHKYNLELNSNDKVLLTGSNGSGKSTLLRIIAGNITNYEGDILINDNKSTYIDLLSSTLYVSQNNSILNMSVKENIKLDSLVTEEKLNEVINVCRINLPLDLVIEDNGFNISGGEKAKIIIARSIVKDYSIYMFDETFNEIDKKGRNELLKNVLLYLKDKIVIVVSHHKLNSKLFNKEIIIES